MLLKNYTSSPLNMTRVTRLWIMFTLIRKIYSYLTIYDVVTFRHYESNDKLENKLNILHPSCALSIISSFLRRYNRNSQKYSLTSYNDMRVTINCNLKQVIESFLDLEELKETKKYIDSNIHNHVIKTFYLGPELDKCIDEFIQTKNRLNASKLEDKLKKQSLKPILLKMLAIHAFAIKYLRNDHLGYYVKSISDIDNLLKNNKEFELNELLDIFDL